MELADPRRRMRSGQPEDPVHAAMGELEAAHLQGFGFSVAIDEPYQHFQSAGRADIVAWRTEPPASLHIENRTRFPNVGQAAGSWNAKRRWLVPELARRLGIAGFRSETHVMACLWSAKVLQTLRGPSRPHSVRWPLTRPMGSRRDGWARRETGSGRPASVVSDPFASGRQPRFIDRETALVTVRPRMRGYPEAAERMARA